jgi:hypothetical protein
LLISEDFLFANDLLPVIQGDKGSE